LSFSAGANPYCVSGANWSANGVMVNLDMPSESLGYIWDSLQTTNLANMVRPVRYWQYVGVNWGYRYWGYLHETDEILDPAAFGNWVDANPGKIWIIGNEPNLTSQDGLTPYEYARMYSTYYDFISGRDPTARFATAACSGDAVPGNVNGTINYWNQVFNAWRNQHGAMDMPVDIWNFHCYAATDNRNARDVIDLYVQPFIDWVRTTQGGIYTDAEIWCTEFGIGFWHGPLNAKWVAPFMQRECLLFEQAGIDRWFWFLGPWDSWSGTWQQTCLLDSSNNPTILGQIYSGLANAYPNTDASPIRDPLPQLPPDLFTDDFEDGNADGWIDKAGDWQVAGGAYRQPFISSWWGYYSQLRYIYNDLDMQADVKINSAPDSANWAGFYFRFPVMFGDRRNGGYLVLLRQNGQLGLHNDIDGTVVSIDGVVVDTSVFHRLRVRCIGNPATIQVYVDGDLEITWTDPNGRFPSGFVALESGRADCTFDNVQIKKVTPPKETTGWRVY
jgi:hypothetical protein